jgi:hypothetical protein
MIEAYQDELEKIINDLEQELNDLLKEREKRFFTLKLDRQIARIKNLLKKYKAESKTSTSEVKAKKTISFIRSLIRKILEINLITNKRLIERKKIKQKSKQIKEEKESQADYKDNNESVKKNNLQKSKGKSIEKEDIDSLSEAPYIHPKILDVHLISLLELEKATNELVFQHPDKANKKHHIYHTFFNENSEKSIDYLKDSEHRFSLTEEIKKYHHDLLNVLNRKTEIYTIEKQPQESNLYNTKQLYLLNNNLLHLKEKVNIQHQYQLPDFTPLLIKPLIKLEILMQVVEKYLLSLARPQNTQSFVKKYQTEMKKNNKEVKIDLLTSLKNRTNANSSYVEKHKLNKIAGTKHFNNLP